MTEISLNLEWGDDDSVGQNGGFDASVEDPLLESNDGPFPDGDQLEFPDTCDDIAGGDPGNFPQPPTVDTGNSRKRSVATILDEAPMCVYTRTKKPKTPFKMFLKDEKNRIMKETSEHDGKPVGDTEVEEIARYRWNRMTAVEKEPYIKRSEESTVKHKNANKKRATTNDMDEKKREKARPVSSSTADSESSSMQRNRSYSESAATKVPPQRSNPRDWQEDSSRCNSTPIPCSTSPFVQGRLSSRPGEGLHRTAYHSQEDNNNVNPARNGGVLQDGVSSVSSQRTPIPMVQSAPHRAISAPSPDSFPVPAGMEIILPDPNTGKDQKYRVQYSCISMTKDEAFRYVGMYQRGTIPSGPSHSQIEPTSPVPSTQMYRAAPPQQVLHRSVSAPSEGFSALPGNQIQGLIPVVQPQLHTRVVSMSHAMHPLGPGPMGERVGLQMPTFSASQSQRPPLASQVVRAHPGIQYRTPGGMQGLPSSQQVAGSTAPAPGSLPIQLYAREQTTQGPYYQDCYRPAL